MEENTTFVSNHHHSAKNNLKRLKSILVNNQEHTNSESKQITINNLYVSCFTLVCLRKGKLSISNGDNTVCCEEKGMIVLEKEQVVSVTLVESNEHMDFEVIEIPTKQLRQLYSLMPNELQGHTILPAIKSRKIFFTPDFPARKEAFNHIKKTLNCTKNFNTGCSSCINNECNENEELFPYFLLFLLTAFLQIPESHQSILKSSKLTLKERVYNIIYSAPGKQWKLTEVAEQIFMSTSTLKRKLAEEDTRFSDIYLSARMNLAAKLLRTGERNVTSVASECGYDSTSYFILCFKRYFKITPSVFIKMANH